MSTYNVTVNAVNTVNLTDGQLTFKLAAISHNFGATIQNGDVINLTRPQGLTINSCNAGANASLVDLSQFEHNSKTMTFSNGLEFIFNALSGGGSFIGYYLTITDTDWSTHRKSFSSNIVTGYGYNGLVCLFNEYDNSLVWIINFLSLGGGTATPPFPIDDKDFQFPVGDGSSYSFTVDTTGKLWEIKNKLAAVLGIPEPDPYYKAGNSSTGGGGGSWDNSSDPVPVPGLPSVGATNTGFISLFVPTQAQLQQVANYLWSNLFDVSTFFKIFENPMDCILGLSVVPVSIPTSGNAQITVGNIELSGITLPLASQQYVEVDCGSLTVDPYFGSYLDYEPYTKMALFVPYSGIHSVNADDIMGKTVNLVYHIDILTGSLVAFLKCGDSVLYEFNGACSSNIPVNSINYASTIENAIRIAVNIGTTVATAGAAAPATVATTAGMQTAQNAGRAISLAGSTAEGALSMKPNIDRAGSLGGTTGILGNQTPYFIVTRPRLCKPKDQNRIKGYPAFINYTISDLEGKGYTEFDTILLTGMYLTDDEKNELERILEGGVYL